MENGGFSWDCYGIFISYGKLWENGGLMGFYGIYPPVNCHKTMAMDRSTMLCMGQLTISMALFNSYVKLPEHISQWMVYNGKSY